MPPTFNTRLGELVNGMLRCRVGVRPGRHRAMGQDAPAGLVEVGQLDRVAPAVDAVGAVVAGQAGAGGVDGVRRHGATSTSEASI